MYTICVEALIDADPDDVWAIVTDVDGWPAWDPHEHDARLDGPFVKGAQGWSKPHGGPATTWTVTDVEPGRRWSSECGLPGGKLSGLNTFDLTTEGKLRCVKTVTVTGPLVPLFRLWFGRGIRRDMSRTFAALQREAARKKA